MTFDINALKSAANEAAKVAPVDMSETGTGGSANVDWPEGVYRGRIVEVVEYGLQPREFDGAKKTPSRSLRLGVMLFPSTKVREALGGEASPKIVRSRELHLSNHGKAGAKQIFDRLNVNKTYQHFAQAIGDAYKFTLRNHVSSTGRKSQVIDWASTQPALDDDTGKPLAVPEAPADAYTLFLFDNPSREMWDKLRIEGKREDGTSKNFLQEKILSALDFRGSALEAMLNGGKDAKPLPSLPEPVEDDADLDVGLDELPEPPTDDEY